jgi:hypothetical protein
VKSREQRASGMETELSVVIDVFFPTAVLSATAKAFASRFPLTPLRLFVEGMGAGYQLRDRGSMRLRCVVDNSGGIPDTR